MAMNIGMATAPTMRSAAAKPIKNKVVRMRLSLSVFEDNKQKEQVGDDGADCDNTVHYNPRNRVDVIHFNKSFLGNENMPKS